MLYSVICGQFQDKTILPIDKLILSWWTTVQEVRTTIEDELLSGNSIYFTYDRSSFIYGIN